MAWHAFSGLQDNFDVRTVGLYQGELESAFAQFGPTYTVFETVWGRTALRRSFHRRRLARKKRAWNAAVEKWSPDLIFANSVGSLLVCDHLAVCRKVPLILYVHEAAGALRQFLREHGRLIGEPARFIACSEVAKEALHNAWGIPPSKISVVPTFLPSAQLEDLTARKRGAKLAGELVIGGAGNSEWIKGMTLWLLMADELRRLLPDRRLKFVWVGIRDNEAGRQFAAEVEKLDLQDLVEQIPAAPDVLEHFARFDVFAMTSWEESASLVCLENMALGTPVVYFASSGGPGELVSRTGVSVGKYSPTEMATAIAALATDLGRCGALGDAARKRAQSLYSSDQHVPALAREIRSALPKEN